MSFNFSLKDTSNISKTAIIVIFLALIRCISEPFRLQFYAPTSLTFDDIKAFLIGALISAGAMFAMTVLFYFGKHRIVIATGILTILILLIVKMIYLIP